jgi:ligand-binding sensor domain-containing protein/serine phosphatase RsbU (regulator of sigma subunit)
MRENLHRFACTALVAGLTCLIPGPARALRQAPAEDPSVAWQAPGRTVRFESLTIEDGFTPAVATVIMQDRTGFLWFGTGSGLSRYDGYEVRTYKHDPDDPRSLGHNQVMGLLEDRDGSIWVGTFGGGLSRFDPATGQFTRFRHDPDDPRSLSHDFVGPLYQDAENVLWIGTEGGGLNRFDPASATFTRFRHDPDDPGSLCDTTDAVRAIYEDRRGALWIGTWSGGLCVLDRESGRFAPFPLTASGAPRTVLAFHEDREGQLWAATEHTGLLRIDRDLGTVSPVEIGGRRMLAETPIGAIHEDSEGSLWLGTWGKGLCRFDPGDETLMCFRQNPYDPHSLADDGVSAVYIDRSGVLWASTWGGLCRVDLRTVGVSRFRYAPNDPNSLSNRDVRTLHVDKSGTVWAGTWSGGLNRMDLDSGRFVHYGYLPGDRRGLSNANVQAILEDRSGAIWVGTWGGGLNRFDRASGTFQRFRHDPTDPGSLHSDSVLEIYEDRDGVLWIGTWDGLSRRDPVTGTFRRVPNESQSAGGPGHVEVSAILRDSAGILWVGTRDDGLGRLDAQQGTLTFSTHDPDDPASLGHNTVWAVREDRDGGLWVATGGGGLNRYDRETGRFTRYTTHDTALGDNVIYAIVEDGSGTLWLNTERGLSRFEPATARVTNYGTRSDLGDCGFNTAAFHDRASGTLYIGCSDGFVAFRPEQLRENPDPPVVVLTDFRVFGRSVEWDAEGPVGGPMVDGREIVLAHDENDLSISFVALHYANPSHNQYAYMLENYDADWRQAGTQRTATYTHLDAGTYVFRVRAANSDGVWTEQGASLRVVIRSPWWLTTPAWLAYAVFLAGLVVALNHLQRRRIVRQEREAALIREKDLRAEAAEARASFLHLENERKTEELEQARRVQLAMLPESVPVHPLVSVAAGMQTAVEVGGDYYDFDLAPDGSLTFVIGDATGHGVQAGIMVTAMKSLWSVFAREPDLLDLVTRTSEALRRMGMPRLYMALAVGRLRGSTLELVGAGMPPAVVWRAKSGCAEHVALKGMPLAGPLTFPYRREVVALEPDDVVVLMSDGFPELFDGSGAMLGYERAAELVAEAVPGRSPDDILARLMEQTDARRAGQPPNDDVTFVVLKASVVGSGSRPARAGREESRGAVVASR